MQPLRIYRLCMQLNMYYDLHMYLPMYPVWDPKSDLMDQSAQSFHSHKRSFLGRPGVYEIKYNVFWYIDVDFWDLCMCSQQTHNITTILHLSCGKVVSYTTFTQRCWDVVSLHNVVTTLQQRRYNVWLNNIQWANMSILMQNTIK